MISKAYYHADGRPWQQKWLEKNIENEFKSVICSYSKLFEIKSYRILIWIIFFLIAIALWQGMSTLPSAFFLPQTKALYKNPSSVWT